MVNLLFIGSPAESIPAFATAQSLGYIPHLVDGDSNSPGLIWARDRGLPWAVVDVYDFYQIHQVVKGWSLNGVMAVGVAVGPVVSLVSKALGLPHISYHITKLSWDKLALKRCLSQAGIAVPDWADFVVKPVDGRGSRGVSVVSASRLWGVEWERAAKASPTGRVMCEQFIRGDGVSIEAIIWDGRIVFAGASDRIYDQSLIVEVGGHAPGQYQYIARNLSLMVCRAIGLKSGTLKLDAIVTPIGDIVVIEAAIGRLGGGHNWKYLSLAYGINFLEMAFAVYSGQEPILRQGQGCHVAGRYEMNGTEARNGDRGKFRMVTGETREEAEGKLSV